MSTKRWEPTRFFPPLTAALMILGSYALDAAKKTEVTADPSPSVLNLECQADRQYLEEQKIQIGGPGGGSLVRSLERVQQMIAAGYAREDETEGGRVYANLSAQLNVRMSVQHIFAIRASADTNAVTLAAVRLGGTPARFVPRPGQAWEFAKEATKERFRQEYTTWHNARVAELRSFRQAWTSKVLSFDPAERRQMDRLGRGETRKDAAYTFCGESKRVNVAVEWWTCEGALGCAPP